MSEPARVNGTAKMSGGERTSGFAGYAPQSLTPLPRGMRFTQKELQHDFDRVCDPWDWRAPVWAQIPAAERELVEQAVLRRTGSQPVFAEVPGNADRLLVFAPGARLGPFVSRNVDVFAIRNGMTMRSWDPQNRWTLLRDLLDRVIGRGPAPGDHEPARGRSLEATLASEGGMG